MSNETRQEIMVKIKEIMADESIFCKDGFSLSDLAELCGSNMKYVSQVLNEDFGKTFNQLLNELRVSVARRRLLDTENYGHLTIEAIVRDIGFKSRSTFSKTFKRITGLSPSEFSTHGRHQGLGQYWFERGTMKDSCLAHQIDTWEHQVEEVKAKKNWTNLRHMILSTKGTWEVK